MASPQKENGHIQISTELWEAWTRIRVSGEAEQVLKAIIRKTYGFNKKYDAISLSQFCLTTSLHRSAVCKALLKLKQMNLITQKVASIASSYSLNKDFDTWKPLPKKIPQSPKGKSASHQKVNKVYPKGDTQKTVTKDTLTTDKGLPPPDARNKDIQELWEYGLKAGLSNTKQTQNRFSIKRLLHNKTLNQLKKAIDFSQQIRQEPYSPQVNNWLDLEEKYLKLRDFVIRQNSKETKQKGHLKL